MFAPRFLHVEFCEMQIKLDAEHYISALLCSAMISSQLCYIPTVMFNISKW